MRGVYNILTIQLYFYYTFAVLDFERKMCTFGAHMETAVVRSEGIRRLHTGASPPSFGTELAVGETS